MQKSIVAAAASPEASDALAAHRPLSPTSAVLVKAGGTVLASTVGGPAQEKSAGGAAVGLSTLSGHAVARADGAQNAANHVSGMCPMDAGPLAFVEQALKQQQFLVSSQMKQFHSQFVGLSQLLEAQAKGLLQTKTLSTTILAELEAEVAARPSVKVQVAQLQQNQAEVAGVHQLLQVSLSKLHKSQKEAHAFHLQETQAQFGGMFSMLRSQSAQLHHSQTQASNLQEFATQAQNALQSATRSQDALQQQLQQLRSEHDAEVQRRKGDLDLQSRQREEREADQRHNVALEKAFLKLEEESHELVRLERQKVQKLQQQLVKLDSQSPTDYEAALAGTSSKPDAESENMKGRIAALEEDLAKVLGDWPDDDELDTPRIVHTEKPTCHWGAPTMASTACS